MKRIDEMTREEIVALTDEKINMLIDYDCAMEGKPLLPPRPTEPKKVEIEPDSLIYEVANITTIDPDHATRILSAIETGTQWDTDYVSGCSGVRRLKTVSDYRRAKIETKKAFSVEKWDEVKNSVNQYETTKRSYDEAKKEYDEAVSARAEISNRIWEMVGESRDEEYRRERTRADFNRYLELSEGNRQVALNFLRKAHNVPDDMAEEFISQVDAEAS